MYFTDIFLDATHIAKQLSPQETLTLPKGSIILVRSDYAFDKYKDHPSIIVGGLIQKDRGVRPNLITLPNIIINITCILNKYKPIDNKIILLLTQQAAEDVMSMMGMHLSSGELMNS